MYKIRKKIMAVLITALMFSLVACGKDTQEVIAVDAEITEESSKEISEEVTTEIEPTLSYVEEYGLEFTNETKVSTKGILSMPDNTDADIIDVDLEIADINISINDDNTNIITIEQIIYGYIWSDGKNIFKTNLNLPSVILCDKNTGKIIPMTTENTTTQIEWGEEKFNIETIETESWEDADWSSDWVDDPNGGERLASILKITDTIKVKDYDALALVLIPITSADNSILGSRIMDIWTDGSYLFSINDLSSKLEQIKDVQIAESEEGEEEIKQEETKSAETSNPTETTAPKENDTKSSHTHNYISTISIQPTCTTKGQKDFKCEICGDSYSETLEMTAHNYVATTTTIHHDAIYESVKIELPGQRVTICSCGAEFSSFSEWDAHSSANIRENGLTSGCAGAYSVEDRPGGVTYDYVEVSPAYDEEIVIYKCSVCGTTTQ